MWPDSNKIFNVALRRKSLPTPGLTHRYRTVCLCRVCNVILQMPMTVGELLCVRYVQ